jgi:hypothetical protein
MSAATLSKFSDPDMPIEELSYRALSRGAVFSVVLSLLAIPLAIAPPLLVVALLGFVIGLISYRRIRRYPEELSGGRAAMAGAALGAIVFFGGIGWHWNVYAHEVKPDYVRTSFSDLQPAKDQPQLPVSPAAIALNGKKVFIKGYVYPDGQQSGIKKFVLVPDLGTCCFGGQPALTDMIEVTLQDPLRVAYSRRRLKLHGVLSVDTRLKPVSGLNGVYYQMVVDQVD